MFFLGASANIIVYVLVSAFFIICLQIKGDAKMPEILPVAANMITIHEPQQVEDGYEYQSFYNQEFKVENALCECHILLEMKYYSPPVFYKNNIFLDFPLRAPPYFI